MIDSLFLLLKKQDIDENEKKSQLNDFYNNYVRGTQNFYINTPVKDIITYIEQEYGKEEVIYRIEMLTEIMYQDSMLEEDLNTKKSKMEQNLALLNYLEENSNTYSMVRVGKIDELKKFLKDL